ncbi:MAG TPA: hypothetical protein RMF84_18495, partial [Polyangiaceae bacterium LLY-WYZ-14_1]|nr:hypothetical protein [Polyangiaceae bacterium LLY-WYZ-14_1]
VTSSNLVGGSKASAPQTTDRGRAVRLRHGGEDCDPQSVLVVAVDPLHASAVRLEARLDVVAHGDGRVTLVEMPLSS